MDENLAEVNENVIRGMGRLTSFFGFNKVMGQLYGALLLSPEPLSLDDLVERLGVSKGTVSVNLRSLERWGMVREAWIKGDRRKYYEAEVDMWKVIANVWSGREQREIEIALRILDQDSQQLEEAMPAMTADDRELARFYLARLANLRELFRFAQLVVQTVLKQRADFDVSKVRQLEEIEVK